MITGQIKNQIDQIWRTFWEGSGITNPMSVLEQMTYLLFMKMLDDVQVQQESLSRQLGIEMAADDATFAYGTWHNPETDEDVPVEELRWHTFKHYDADRMYRTISRNVFPYIKNLNTGSDSAYSRFMGNAVFLIQSPKVLVKIVDGIDSLENKCLQSLQKLHLLIIDKSDSSDLSDLSDSSDQSDPSSNTPIL
ncbi:MAG: type I restriction-modification system subunit M N-terminal domain-containing protein [Muribaculaceae bacterium]